MSTIKGRENNLLKFTFLLSFILSTFVVWGTSSSPCGSPPNHLSILQKDTTHITLQWEDTNSPAETLWNIGYRDIATNTWSNVVASTNPFTVANLQSGVTYEFRVRSDCGSTKSGWSVNTILATTDINNGLGCNLNLAIPDNNCPTGITFNINVSDAEVGSVLGDNVKLREVNIIVDHIWEQDLTMKLIAPNGASVVLTSNNGGANISGYGINDGTCSKYTSFTENSCNAHFSINDHSLLSFNGSFYPENSFSGLDGSLANGLWQLVICDDAPNHVGKLVFVELVLSPFNCSPPTNVFVTDEGATHFVVNWDGVIAGEAYRVSVVEKGFPLSSSTLFPTNNNFLEIQNLQPNTEYQVVVQRECIGGRFSDLSCPVIGQTICNLTSPSIVDNFDDEPLCESNCSTPCELIGFWKNIEGDDLDWSVQQGATPTAFTGPLDDVTRGGKYLYLESSNIACNNGEGMLTSNCTYIDAPFSDCHLGFSYYMYGLEVNSLKIEINDFSGTGWTTIWQKNGSQANQWLRAYIDLQTYHDKNVQFRVVGRTGVNGNSDIAIDDFEFYGSVDNGIGVYSYFRDFDGDGFGDENDVVHSCLSSAPIGYIVQGGDCDDTNLMINPNGVEILCNQIDENCNGMADDSDIELLELSDTEVQICFGESAELKVVSTPEGRIEWFDQPVGGNKITTGSVFHTGPLNRKQSYYVQDAVEIGSGLRITQILINYFNSGVEIQNIDEARDYTGWKVYLSDDRLNINNYLSTPWNLGQMALKQVMTRTKSNWGADFKWLSGSAFKGWVMIMDNQNNVQDVLFWNWSASDIQSFQTTINGVNITASDLPWSGSGFSQGSCPSSENTNILLMGSDETDSMLDYECGASNFGQPNPNLNYYFTCISGRSKVDVVVSKVILDAHVYQNQCENGGNIEIIASNGIEPYVYNWSNGADTSILEQLDPDVYTVTVTDAIGCSEVSQPFNFLGFTNDFGIDILNVEQITCNQARNGKIVMRVMDGQAPYQFNWTGGFERDLTNDLDSIVNLDGGNYILTVTDNNGCIITSDEIAIVEPDPILLTVDSIVDLKCAHIPTGEIYTTTTGGTIPYSLHWNNGLETAHIDNQLAGEYQLTVTDANDCVVEISTKIREPEQELKAEILKLENVTCFGSKNGRIEVNAYGGVPGYKYNWSNGKKAPMINNLSGGEYRVTVSDGNDCNFSFDQALTVLEPSSPLQINPSITNAKCNGLNDGKIVLNTSGGMPPYKYIWSENKSAEDSLVGLAPGVYVCSITDNFGCPKVSDKMKVVLSDYDLQVESATLNNVSCHGEDDGSIILNVSGGQLPYSVLWENDSLGLERTDLGKGIYYATVSDYFGCNIKTSNFAISEPDALTIDTIYITNQSSNVSNGVASVIISGGTWPYTYVWNDDLNQKTQTAVGLSKGEYNVTITDANGCTVVGECSIVVLANDDVKFSKEIVLYPNPTSEIVNIQYAGMDNLSFAIFSNLGTELHVPIRKNVHQYQLDLSNLVDGVYFVHIMSRSGDRMTERVVLMR